MLGHRISLLRELTDPFSGRFYFAKITVIFDTISWYASYSYSFAKGIFLGRMGGYMAKNCPGCGAPMEYDPGFDALVCGSCGNIIDPKSLPDAKEFYLNYDEDETTALEDTLEEEELTGETYDCHIYTCSQCGGEVIVSGTEVSTKCVYCGSTAVVFNRIAKERRPDYILPFKVSKEEAVANVKKQLKAGFFVPRYFKVTEPSVVRGIYVPYFLYEGWFKDTQRFMVGHETRIYDGECEFIDLPVEACKNLADQTTMQLEPFHLNEKVEFDSSYLMGFYSNIQDLDLKHAKGNATMKARAFFDEEVLRQIRSGTVRKIKRVTSVPKSEFARSSYALLPVWFVSIEKKGTPYTFLINGQTGKVVGTVPWNRLLAALMIGVSFLALASFSTFFFIKSGILPAAMGYTESVARASRKTGGYEEIYGGLAVISAALGLMGYGFARFKKVLDNLNLSRSVVTFIFSKKRQGDAK